MLRSPYAPGSFPDVLAGRGRELQLIADRLDRVDALARSAGPLLAFYGPRGYGKTSLLRRAQRVAIGRGFLTIWATGRDDSPLDRDLLNALEGEIQASDLRSHAATLLASLERVQVEIGIPGAAKVTAQSAPREVAESVEDALKGAALLARAHDRRGLVVFIDEFQDAPVADRRSLLIALQHFDGAPIGCPIAVVAAGLPSLPAAIIEAATFGERTDFYELHRLNDVAIIEALKLPADHLGVRWEQDALEGAIPLTEGYPHEVQLLGEETWNAARPIAGDTITLGHVQCGQEGVARRMEQLFRARIAKTTPDQRQFLVAMASLGDGEIARADIAKALGVETRTISRPRQELVGRGIIEPSSRGYLRFTVPGFAKFVRAMDTQEFGNR